MVPSIGDCRPSCFALPVAFKFTPTGRISTSRTNPSTSLALICSFYHTSFAEPSVGFQVTHIQREVSHHCVYTSRNRFRLSQRQVSPGDQPSSIQGRIG